MADQNFDPDMYTKFNMFTSKYHRDTYPALQAALSTGKGKYVLITGASKFIGRGMALSWAKAGAAGIAICSRTAETIDPVAAEIKALSQSTEVLAASCDVTKPADVANFFKATKEKFGKLDVVIANVGLGAYGSVGQVAQEQWWHEFEVNYRHAYLVADSYIRTFGPDPSGTLITMASGVVTVVMPGLSSYGMSKRACIQLVEYLDVEYPNLKAFSLDPGVVKEAARMPAFMPYAHDTYDLVGDFTVWLASGKADKIKGGFVHTTWDVEELEQHGDEIKEKALLKSKFLSGILGQPGGCLGK